MKKWLKNNTLVSLLVLAYIIVGIILLPNLSDSFNKSSFDKSILKVIIDAFLANVWFALSLSFVISFVLSLIIMLYQYFIKDRIENVIKSFTFVVLVVNIYVFICTLTLLAITPDNGEAIIALFGFFYGFTKYLPWAYDLINDKLNLPDWDDKDKQG